MEIETEEILKLFGSKVKEYRIKRNYTQENLAEKVGLSVQELEQIETGEKEIDTTMARKIARQLRVTLAELFDML